MKLVITPTAEAQIDHQFTEGIARFGRRTAEKTFARVDHFFQTTLLQYPGAGTFIAERKLYEWYITRTPFVAVYRIEADADLVRLLAFFHHAQDRSDFDPDT